VEFSYYHFMIDLLWR